MSNQTTISVLTLVRDRKSHLTNLLKGLLLSEQWPSEFIIVHMNEEKWPVSESINLSELPDNIRYQDLNTGSPFAPQEYDAFFHRGDEKICIKQIVVNGIDKQLPLTKARNRAVSVSKGDHLIFLDADCIPSPDYLEEMSYSIDRTRGIVMSDVHYLAAGSSEDGWTFERFDASAIPHPRRPSLSPGDLERSEQYYLFWSLSFGCKRKTFARIGGFDPRFTGYGGEDTDFALSARHAGVPLYFSGAIAYHQYHTTISPPLNHLESIIDNANIYKQKWGRWPMENWLRAFQKGGFVDWNDNRLRLRRLPTKGELRSHKSEKLFA